MSVKYRIGELIDVFDPKDEIFCPASIVGVTYNKNYVGDIGYRPVNLYSVIVEKIPAAVILWRSFMVTLLDRMEKILPTLTPDEMIDESPKMRPYDFG